MKIFSGMAVMSLILAGGLFPAVAQNRVWPVCSMARENFAKDPPLERAMIAAFGGPLHFLPTSDKNMPCVQPVKLLHYAGEEALVTLTQPAGSVGVGLVSAYMFQTRHSGPQLVSVLHNFIESGSVGDPGKINAVRIGHDDGLVIENGDAYRGYSAQILSTFVLRDGRLVPFRPLLVGASNEGAVQDDTDVVAVEYTAAFGVPDRDSLTLHFKITNRCAVRHQEVVMHARGTDWIIASGVMPPEIRETVGG